MLYVYAHMYKTGCKKPLLHTNTIRNTVNILPRNRVCICSQDKRHVTVSQSLHIYLLVRQPQLPEKYSSKPMYANTVHYDKCNKQVFQFTTFGSGF